MMPNVRGEKHTKLEILVYSVLLVVSTLAPVLTGLGGWLYGAVAAAAGAWFLVLAGRLFVADGVEMKKAGRKLFTYSLVYLFAIFLAFIADHGLRLAGVI